MALASDKADAAFADLVYADQELVDAEFAGIVAASLGWPPTPPPAAPPGFPSLPGLPHPAYPPFEAVAPAPFATAWPPRGRQRSPPGMTGRTCGHRAAAKRPDR